MYFSLKKEKLKPAAWTYYAWMFFILLGFRPSVWAFWALCSILATGVTVKVWVIWQGLRPGYWRLFSALIVFSFCLLLHSTVLLHLMEEVSSSSTILQLRVYCALCWKFYFLENFIWTSLGKTNDSVTCKTDTREPNRLKDYFRY